MVEDTCEWTEGVVKRVVGNGSLGLAITYLQGVGGVVGLGVATTREGGVEGEGERTLLVEGAEHVVEVETVENIIRQWEEYRCV